MSIRLRVALVFALALAIAFTLGGWLFISQLSAAMQRTTDANLAARLQAVGSSENEGDSGPAITSAALAPGEYVVQTITPSGHVKNSNAGSASLLTRAELAQARRGKVLLTRTFEG